MSEQQDIHDREASTTDDHDNPVENGMYLNKCISDTCCYRNQCPKKRLNEYINGNIKWQNQNHD